MTYVLQNLTGLKTQNWRTFARTLGLMSALAATAIVYSGSAQARPDTRQLTCQQVQAIINENGEVVLTTGPGTYKRFVATGQYCIHGERASSEWVDAADGSCRVRSVCKTIRPGSSR